MRIRIARSLADVDARQWDALAGDRDDDAVVERADHGIRVDDNPFIEHAFLAALEDTGCTGTGQPWDARHIVVEDEGRIVAAMPCYRRTDSFGEYIFDWRIAEAAARVGLRYYPKLTCAVPFTPATGPRLLLHSTLRGAARDAARRVLLQGLDELARDEQASSVHVLFCTGRDTRTLQAHGLHRRASLQFHWRNDGYASFDDFLERLDHDARKQIRRERRRVRESGVDVVVQLGAEVEPGLWPQLYALYTSTSDRKWGRPYLTPEFFAQIPERLGTRAVVATARRDGEVIAMTLSFERGRHLYGRHWGCSVDVPGLHFELCYYALLDRAIARGQTLVEAGAQGEHKLKRGYLPVITHSAHRMLHPAFDRAVAASFVEEEEHILREQQELAAHGPFKQGAAPPVPLVAGLDGV